MRPTTATPCSPPTPKRGPGRSAVHRRLKPRDVHAMGDDDGRKPELRVPSSVRQTRTSARRASHAVQRLGRPVP